MASSDSTEVKASCMCGQLSATAQVPNSDLPLNLWLCSCDTCRHVSGHIAITSVDIHQPLKVNGTPSRYTTSGGDRGITRCFCGTCGTTVYEDSDNVARIGFSGGAIDNEDLSILKAKGQLFVGDTKDGGLKEWLPDIPSYETGPNEEFAGGYESTPLAKSSSPSSKDKLHCSCACGGVQFDISPPTEESAKAIPPKEGSKPFAWWLSPDQKKYTAGFCVCNSCRKAGGYDLQPWSFIPVVNLHQKDGSDWTYDFGTLKEYKSSAEAIRHFCGKCGANVFWRGMERPQLVDVSVGLMDAKSGSRAEEWLAWYKQRISHVQDGKNKVLVDHLKKGFGIPLDEPKKD